MIIAVAPIFFGIYRHCRANKIGFKSTTIKFLFLFIITVFFISLYIVGNHRDKIFSDVSLPSENSFNVTINLPVDKHNPEITSIETFLTNPKVQSLLIDRWVGLDSAVAVAAKKDKSIDLLLQGFKERDTKELSFYDKFFIDSPYKFIDNTKRHFITLPGFISFSYYSGSYYIAFILTGLFVFFACFIEEISLRFTYGNHMIAALIANLTAYRFVSFGYAPINTLYYFLIIIMTVFVYFYSLNLIEKLNVKQSE